MSAAFDAQDGSRVGRGTSWGERGPGGSSYRCGFGMGWKPMELLAMILGFMVFWPIGLGVIAWKVWQKKSQYQGDFAAFAEEKWRAATSGFALAPRGDRWRPFASGNTAFDDWREVEFARLEEERRKLDAAHREFSEYVNNLRRAKDREEFERFMAERRQRDQNRTQERPPGGPEA